jgi:hypothetical protein
MSHGARGAGANAKSTVVARGNEKIMTKYPKETRMAHCSGPAHLVRIVSPKWLALSLLSLALIEPATGVAADDYLQSIEVEADKVGAEPAVSPDSPISAGTQAPSSPMQAFEKQLEDRFAGTYLFYKRLPPEAKEEIYRQFKGGAPIEDVRRTIMNRFLHTR